MSVILGIDTGGTYTDGVLIDKSNNKIMSKSKALTTREKLSVGIADCLHNLVLDQYEDIELVCLSTTLATNAIVENKGCRVGLITIGKMPDGELPAQEIRVVQGKFDIYGNLVDNLQYDQVKNAVQQLEGKVEAIAISGYASIRNPAHEISARELASVLNVPVVCAHELTGSLGFYERTVTAILNAKLIPIIKELIHECQSILDQLQINAPLMIVKGDGGLISEEFALARPIETVLSGPAASINGGIFLTGLENALIIDIGGTTTDVADVNDGFVKLNPHGANVNGWLTRVRAAEIYTYGIGGDSGLKGAMQGMGSFGPEKAIPYCFAASLFPVLEKELQRCLETGIAIDHLDCYTTFKNDNTHNLDEKELSIYNLISSAPHTLQFLLGYCEIEELQGIINTLLEWDLIARISFTPTDVLHAKGVYCKWNNNASRIVAQIMAQNLGISLEEFLYRCSEQIARQIVNACKSSIVKGRRFNDKNGKERIIKEFLNEKPIVAIGAPAAAWQKPVSDLITTTVIVPEHAEVANAIGAAVGKIVHCCEALIRPHFVEETYIAYTHESREVFATLEEAKQFSVNAVKKQAEKLCSLSGCHHYEFVTDINDVITTSTDEPLYVETRIKITGIGAPACIRYS